MKKISYIIFLALLLCCVVFFAACTENEGDGVVTYTVTFNSNGGNAVPSQTVVKGGHAVLPAEPQMDGYIFKCWELDNVAWNFEANTVEGDITLTAVWINADNVYDFTALDNGNLCLTKYKGDQSIVRVPSKINGVTVEAIGNDLFSGVSFQSVDKIIVPESIKIVGENAFKGCSNITIEIKGALTQIGECAFQGCNRLGAVTLGEGIEEIPFAAFNGCTSLKGIMLPKGTKIIRENAFEECSGLMFVILPEDFETVEESAFRDCDALAAVYYYGTEQSYDAITVDGSYNTTFEDAKVYLYSEEAPTLEGEYWYFDNRGNIKLWK